MSQSLFSQPLNVINVGIAMFSDDLKKQHVEVTQFDWTPPLTSRRWSALSSRIRC